MKTSYFVSILVCLILFSVCLIVGCGSNATGGGGGGGGAAAPFAADVWVSTTGTDSATGTYSDPVKTIQKGLDMATSHEVVGVKAGVYTEEVTWPASTDVTLRGVSRTSAILHGNNTDSIIFISSGVPSSQTITIESLTLANSHTPSDGGAINEASSGNNIYLKDLIIKDNSAGASSAGGGVYTDSSTGTLIVEGCTFSNNFAHDGGAIRTHCPTLIKNCTINDNTADAYAGGISFGMAATSYIYNTTIEGNAVTGGSNGGGGIYNEGCTATMESCDIIGNNGKTTGGGVDYDGGSGVKMFFNKCRFKDNHALTAGAIFTHNGIQIEKCLFENNTAESSNGGAINIYTDGYAEIVNSIFKRNISTLHEGGAIYFSNGGSNSLDVYNCTFISNEAGTAGSAIEMAGGGTDVTIVNCIFWKNKNPGSIYEVSSPSTTFTISNCDFASGAIHNGSETADTNSAPAFVSYLNDLHLANTCTTDVTEGGTDTDAPNDDYDGISRTIPYSIGAYEKDII